MIMLKNVQKNGTLGGPKVEKKVKCLTKWVRLAPIELKLCRNDQAMIRTSILLILANFSQFFEGKSRFFFFLSPLPPPELSIFPVFSRTNGWLPHREQRNPETLSQISATTADRCFLEAAIMQCPTIAIFWGSKKTFLACRGKGFF